MRRVLSLALAVFATPLFAADPPFFFQKNDRIVFLGDSITEQYQYSTYVEMYLTTRFPDWNLTFLNAGIGGDTAVGGAGRFQAHVLDEKPTAVTINFGMNDAGYGKFDPGRQKVYAEKTAAMLAMAKKAGVRVALMSPNAVDRRRNPNFRLYVETQKDFYAPLKGLAEEHGAAFVDQYAVTRAAVEKMEADKADTVVPYPDGFHTGPPGGLLMAHAILTGLGAPAKVSAVTIDVAAKTAEAEKCKVENLTVTADAVAFDRSDEALPMPVLREWLSILPYVNGLKDLNDYGLRVKGLTKGIWGVSIGGVEVAKASADELEKGVSLGMAAGPVYDQGVKVFQAIQAKNVMLHRRFREVLMFQVPDWLGLDAATVAERRKTELAKRMEQIKDRQEEIYKMVKPAPQRFELKLQK
jgi:lysophospholipase L1-like esterase